MFDLFRSRQKAVRYVLGGILAAYRRFHGRHADPGLRQQLRHQTTTIRCIAEIGSTKITSQEYGPRCKRMLGGQNAPRHDRNLPAPVHRSRDPAARDDL